LKINQALYKMTMTLLYLRMISPKADGALPGRFQQVLALLQCPLGAFRIEVGKLGVQPGVQDGRFPAIL
jgi:hypothetical protein